MTNCWSTKSCLIFLNFPHGLSYDLSKFKGAVSRFSGIFCPFFAQAKNGYCSRKCCGHQLGLPREQFHRPGWVEQTSFSSSNCRIPGHCLVAAIIFPHTKWPPKITGYRDTPALMMTLPRFSTLKDHDKVPWQKLKNLRQTFVAMSMMNKCAKFHGDSPRGY